MWQLKNKLITHEYKSSFTDAVIETLTAFANTKGGEVLVGVDNNGVPIPGFAIGAESVQQYINEIKNKTRPSIVPDVEINALNGTEVLKFTIQEFPVKPVSFKGRYYKRIKNSNHQLSPHEIPMRKYSLQPKMRMWVFHLAIKKQIINR